MFEQKYLDNVEDFPLVYIKFNLISNYSIDAKEYGNLARFINHSCDPNLRSVNVHKNSKDPRIAVITFFATKNIKAG